MTKSFDVIEDEWSRWCRYLAWRTKEELRRAGFDVEKKQ